MTCDTNRTVRQALLDTQKRFTTGNIAAPALDARVLLRHVLDLTAAELFLHLDEHLTGDSVTIFSGFVARRLVGEPVAYLTGRREFYGLDFHVSPDVLIPRPETELLVERAIALLPNDARVIDVGTGSGAVAVAAADNRPDVRILAIDQSLAACRVALSNVRAHGVQNQVSVVCSDLLSAVTAPFDAVLANLPYLRLDELTALSPEVQREPRQALDGGLDGLALYRRLFSDLAEWRPGPALVLCEIAPMLRDAMLTLVGAALPDHNVQVVPDLAGRSRLVEAHLHSPPSL